MGTMAGFFKLLSGVLTLIALAVGSEAQLKYQPEFIFSQVLQRKNAELDSTKPFPEIKYASRSTLKEFQDDIEPQWGIRPDVITNAYVVQKNIIYLLDDQSYYEKNQRCMDDSLAHELTHYVQSKYKGWDLNDDSLEMDAIDVQTWFRETYCR